MYKKRALYLVVIILIAAAAIVAILLFTNHPAKRPSEKVRPSAGNSNKVSVPSESATLEHIFIIVEENKPYSDIVGNSQAPYLNSLINRYALATNYSAVANPSLPNYLALTSGSNDGITTDCNPPSAGCKVNVNNIADEIEKSGRSWKEYAESMPTNCYALNAGDYATKHNPFVYYDDIVNNTARCNAHVVPFSQLAGDLNSLNTTPDYAFITPNLCNDMHDCSVSTGDNWLAREVPAILSSQAFTKQNSLLAITWDEGTAGDNQVPTILAGPAVKAGYKSSKPYNHYALLHTIEKEWSLAPLTTNDAQAPDMIEFLK